MEFLILAVSQHRHHEPGWCCHSDGDVDIVPLHNFVAVDDRVDNWVLLKGKCGCSDEEGHESKLDSVFFKEIFT